MPAGGSKLGGRNGDVAGSNPTMLEFVGSWALLSQFAGREGVGAGGYLMFFL